MDDSKTPFLSEEARHNSNPYESDDIHPEKNHHQHEPSPPDSTAERTVSRRTARAFKIAFVIWLGVVFVTYMAMPKGACSLHRKPTEQMAMMEDHVPGGDFTAPLGSGASGKLGYKVVEDLPKKLIPHHGNYWGDHGNDRRLIFIGDVHGSYRPLRALLKKVNHDQSKDHIILLGDMITRGRKSLEVLNYAMSLNASCVRGNHEDRILLLRKQIVKHPKSTHELERNSNQKLKAEIKLARKLTNEQTRWLEECPVILNINDVPGVGHVAAVHAGLRVGVPLAKQDPVQVMNMRSIDPTTGTPTSEKSSNKHHWATYWNNAQRHVRNPITVVYGHYASYGLDVRRWSFGLDSDCNRGGKLSAWVVDASKRGGTIVQVDCKKLADKSEGEGQ
ncbi:Metallo-dependent phosphatase [Ascobolus immersus RN42]|uniref:Metallo-dependent phosphatase n=1 Tax=Ascobolus immersus RN42 TaxID=1160509 RepID=A0A3N4I7G1_ASCIM|nr:Metallo-dependent phosphatase [Ascobolus immersus RN42]